jgi:hypothetical protein
MAWFVETGPLTTSRTSRGACTAGVGGRSFNLVMGDNNWYTKLRVVTCRLGVA